MPAFSHFASNWARSFEKRFSVQQTRPEFVVALGQRCCPAPNREDGVNSLQPQSRNLGRTQRDLSGKNDRPLSISALRNSQ